jgi:hypothetical protein
VADVLVELLVFLVLDLGARTGPQGAGAVDGFPFLRRLLFALGGFACSFGISIGRAMWSEYFLMMLRRRQPSANSSSPFSGAGRCGCRARLVDGGNFEFAFALGRPVHAFGGGQAGAAAEHVDLVGDDEAE